MAELNLQLEKDAQFSKILHGQLAAERSLQRGGGDSTQRKGLLKIEIVTQASSSQAARGGEIN